MSELTPLSRQLLDAGRRTHRLPGSSVARIRGRLEAELLPESGHVWGARQATAALAAVLCCALATAGLQRRREQEWEPRLPAVAQSVPASEERLTRAPEGLAASGPVVAKAVVRKRRSPGSGRPPAGKRVIADVSPPVEPSPVLPPPGSDSPVSTDAEVAVSKAPSPVLAVQSTVWALGAADAPALEPAVNRVAAVALARSLFEDKRSAAFRERAPLLPFTPSGVEGPSSG